MRGIGLTCGLLFVAKKKRLPEGESDLLRCSEEEEEEGEVDVV
jgi:hypothetical protein